MRETRAAVVVSEEQGEVEKFRRWDLDIVPHRKLIKDGMELPATMRSTPRFRNMQRMAVDDAFKEQEHPFRIAIVCAMWLTGFRRTQPRHALPGQAAQGPHADAGHRPCQPGQRRQEQRTDRGLLRHPQASAQGAGDVRRHAAGRRRQGDRSGETGTRSCLKTSPRRSRWCGPFSTKAGRRSTTSSGRTALGATRPSWPARRRRIGTTRPASASRCCAARCSRSSRRASTSGA